MVLWVFTLLALLSAPSVITMTENLTLTVLCVVDSNTTSDCEGVVDDLPEDDKRLSKNVTFRTTTVRSMDNLLDTLSQLQSAVNRERPQVLLTIGGYAMVSSAAMFAQFYDIPQISLVNDDNGPPLYANNYLGFGPSGETLAEVIFYLIRMQNITEVTVIHDIQLDNDGFVSNLKQLANASNTLKRIKIYGTSTGCDADRFFHRKLIELRDNGSRLIVLHVGQELSYSIIQCAIGLDLFLSGHVWIVTTDVFNKNVSPSELPVGLLALQYQPSSGYKREMRNSLVQISSTVNNILQEGKTNLSYLACQDCRNFTSSELASLILRQMNTYWQRPKVSYSLINLVQTNNHYDWRIVGILQKDKVEIDSIVWPGGLVYGPIAKAKKLLRVATVPAPPFVLHREPDNDERECYTDTPCLKLKKIDRVIEYLDHFIKGGPAEEQQYDFMCCSGLSIDLLNRLALDLDFEFVLYYFPSSVGNVIGKLVDGKWDGVIGQVYYGVADIMIGAFSITAARSQWIDFTEPFYQSGFTMLSVKEDQQPKIDAFLEPFSTHLWLTIMMSAVGIAIVLSFLEWRSPFGLNPWGRKRDRNYTLGSALVMVYSVLFGHTVATKSPKSWPSRLIQNVWSVFAIVMVASYTANLAAFLAGKENTTFFKGIFDPGLQSKRLAVIGETSVASYIAQLNPPVFHNMRKTNVRTSAGMIKMMKNGEFDIFIHDLPILEYARARLDGDCNLRIVSTTFGDDGYGIGLAKGSPWKSRMSELILSYILSGFLEELQRAHFSQLTCTTAGINRGDMQYGLMHTGGLFIMLAVAIALGVLLVLLEHWFFKYYIPKLRKLPPSSRFKNINMMFLSQRLYRTMTCDEVMPSTQGARQMADLVKNKQFVKLFQKEQLRVPAQKRIFSPVKPDNLLWLSKKAVHDRVREMSHSNSERTQHDDPEGVVVTVDIHQSEGDISPETTADEHFNNLDPQSLEDPADSDTISACSSVFSHHSSIESERGWPSDWEQDWLDDSTPTGTVISDHRPLEVDQSVLGFDNPAFIMNNERIHDRPSSIKRHISLKEIDLNMHSHAKLSSAPLTKSYSWRPPRNIWTISENLEHYRVIRNRHVSSERNCYRNTPHMKDNRMKSRIRRDTLEGLCKKFSVDFIDSFTLESLSKDELLVLWKASEINLRRRLEEMTRQRDALQVLLQRGTGDNRSDTLHSNSTDAE